MRRKRRRRPERHWSVSVWADELFQKRQDFGPLTRRAALSTAARMVFNGFTVKINRLERPLAT